MKVRLLLLLSVAALGAGAGCGKRETPAAPTQPEAAKSNPLTAPADYVGAVGSALKHSAKVVDTVSLNQTIQQFHALEERYPSNLNELVTMKYLPSVPTAPTGMKIQYDPRSGRVQIVRAP
ncbi:MAG: hypothetical protein FJ387_18065 [Verrucomicrobia bacterium]|nr:hypothetical protein [Verrucomicrobiota bacterium]